MNYDAYRTVKTFSCLDGLRCLSIVAVVWMHCFKNSATFDYFPAARLGFLGVDLFFEISGFLIVTLLLRERDRTGGVSLRKFYGRRFLRIFPLYYGLLLLYAIAFLVLRPSSPAAAEFRHDLPALLTYLTNWLPAAGMLMITWSLSAEEQFYVVWPAVEKKLVGLAVGIVLLLLLVSELIQFGALDPLLQHWFGWDAKHPGMLRETTFAPILLGVLLAHILHSPKGYAALGRLCARRLSAPFWLAVLLVLCNVVPPDIRGWARPSVHVVMFLLLASSVMREDNGLRGLLTWAPVARIGVLSYGIYLLHLIAIVLIAKGLGKAHADHWLLRWALSLLLAVGFAELSYRFYESRFLRMKTRFSA